MFDFVSFFPRAVMQGIPLLFGATGLACLKLVPKPP